MIIPYICAKIGDCICLGCELKRRIATCTRHIDGALFDLEHSELHAQRARTVATFMDGMKKSILECQDKLANLSPEQRGLCGRFTLCRDLDELVR